MNEAQKAELMEKMDKAAEVARDELAELVVKYPEVAEAFGAWAAKHKNTAGYKRLAKLVVSLG